MVRGPDSIPNDIARLRGSRFVTAAEADQGQRLAEALVKQMTGGDVMTARFMRAEFFDFSPTFKVFLATNHKPEIRGSDYAMWRRIRLVPFTVTIPAEEQDHQLEQKLRAELPGILRWSVEGCLALQRHTLGVPKEIQAATDAYRSEMDVFGHYLAERCTEDPLADVSVKDFYDDYSAWCKATNERPLSKRAFGLRLADRGFQQTRSARVRGWRGLRLRTQDDPDPSPDNFDEPGDATERVTQHDASFLIDPLEVYAINSFGESCDLESLVTDVSPEQFRS
jgi:putative DNA primase/helicase